MLLAVVAQGARREQHEQRAQPFAVFPVARGEAGEHAEHIEVLLDLFLDARAQPRMAAGVQLGKKPVDIDHPDLRLVTGYDYGDNDSNPDDNSSSPGHGTACAGVARLRPMGSSANRPTTTRSRVPKVSRISIPSTSSAAADAVSSCHRSFGCEWPWASPWRRPTRTSGRWTSTS